MGATHQAGAGRLETLGRTLLSDADSKTRYCVVSRILRLEGTSLFLHGLSAPRASRRGGKHDRDGQGAEFWRIVALHPLIPFCAVFLTVLSITLIGKRLRAEQISPAGAH